MRQLAKKIDLDPSALSLTLRGRRGMKLREASEIAQLLGVTVEDVLANAGVRHTPQGERMIPVVGVMRGDLTAQIDWRAKTEHVPGPHDLPERSFAVVADTAMTQLAAFDGWIYYIGEPRERIGELIGRNVFAALPGQKEVVNCFLSRSHRAARYNMRHFIGEPREGVEIEWAAPILWIKPQ